MVPLFERRRLFFGGLFGLKHQTVHEWNEYPVARFCCMWEGVMAAGIRVESELSGSQRKGLSGMKLAGSRNGGVYDRVAWLTSRSVRMDLRARGPAMAAMT